MPNVYWIKGRSSNVTQNIVAKIDRLLGIEELARLISPQKSLAIKINLSEVGYNHYLPPIFIATLFEKIRHRETRPVVTDSCSIFKGSRFSGYDWANTSIVQGFSNGETFDNQLMLAGGYTCEEGKFYPSDGNRIGGVELGSLLTDTGNIIVLSHVTAHPLLGIAGAISNLGLGFLTNTGKLRIHECLDLEFDASKCDGCKICLPYCPTGALSDGEPCISFDSRICNNCLGCFMTCPRKAFSVRQETVPEFQESVVDAAQTARKHLRGGAFFINVLSSVTPQTDEYPFSDIPFMPDLGIIASEDPVAADWATHQMILRGPGVPGSIAQDLNVMEKGQDKIKAITNQSPLQLLEYAETLKLGTKNFAFLS